MGKYIIHSTLRPIGSQVVNKLGMFSFLSDEPVAAKGTDSAQIPFNIYWPPLGVVWVQRLVTLKIMSQA